MLTDTSFRSSGFLATDPIGGGQNRGNASDYSYLPSGLVGDVPVFNPATGKYHSSKTNQPFHGNYGGTTYNNGVATGQEIPYSGGASVNPNSPARYQPINIDKGSPVAGPAASLLASEVATTPEGLKDFSSYLSEAKGNVPAAVAASKAAADISPTVNALTGAQQRYVTDLGAANQRYQLQLGQNKAAEEGVVNQANATLPMYDSAMNRAELLAQQAAGGVVSRYGMNRNAASGGTNLGLGTDVADLALKESYAASLPYEMAKVDRRFSNLSNYNLPVARDIGQQGISYAGSFLPAIGSQAFQSAQGTATAIQGLKEAASRMDWQTVQQILQLPGAASAIRNAIYSGDQQLLAAFNQLYSQTNYQGLQDILGAQVNTPQGYSFNNPGYPARGGYPVGGYGGVSSGPSGVPVAPAYNQAIDPATGLPYSNINYASSPVRYGFGGVVQPTGGDLGTGE